MNDGFVICKASSSSKQIQVKPGVSPDWRSSLFGLKGEGTGQ